MPRLLIAASGTGGHIFPALSVCNALPGSWDISWLGVPNRLESEVVPAKFEMTKIPIEGLQANKGIKKIVQIIKLIASTFFVIRLLRRKNIETVFTTGGYIAAPAIIAAKLCGISVILHESNAFPGKSTRLLGRLCSQVALGLPNAAKDLKNCRICFTGTPVRAEFLIDNPLPSWVPKGVGPLIVAMGGSQGAVGLNSMVRKNVPWLLGQGCRIVLITGKNDEKSEFFDKNFVEKEFTHEIPGLLQHADLVISRSGAGALTELAICNAPTIFVPYPYAADNHQDYNAAYAAEFGAAVIVHQNTAGHKSLRRALNTLLNSYFSSRDMQSDLLAKMREGMKKIAIRDAHLQLVDVIQNHG
ncbi:MULTISPECIES: UDP-N-acetylglucosamine--N-acetylmuramyl-(pentapeptide) pyrophosphoryl-undecaprenol N-acetylglucosamine transferase [unclassified Prochlorococcus]|uniref:UDP-N-acetylglucosamine--N-acetylmuramyl- (pentapeptide) pyrophosphoryl-undecaprenol N-acetylglucosamine transferase n=1 Tax=unclassified Prochlorococcus TaxID=2627481 RepID=UPI0005339373|nr:MULTISPECIES: UDP-N-acetylglucosamine--N-acetylmuramyl-(pentapeptide) pyrophosphoryl-undecaprenol N-acetylglucosamine transferase [unclassified Prochlorococcus]KGG16740.1 UDP-N-acetylglucosamine--N-acetylmuramyl- (pentapeptide) pyrophosphoryl-undecaprenol N-acetylglucosamine transferase [Prochlorococcus sp. MIT 0602]KGG18287.1 UDP-N-acetylglucosamine--N-acetylmuramyl- (pentapeptide) pyrophosphoryl-undecaprenol N-acetylglucosamine transferase [Prochlorococcus sp. MIT 0603]